MDSEPKESHDLLMERKLDSNNVDFVKFELATDSTAEQSRGPPDGGLRAYSVVIASFLTNGLLFGVINSYSAVYDVLQMQLHDQSVPNSESRASLVGALALGTTFLLSPVSGILTDILGIRVTAVLGGSIAAAGLLISSFAVNHVDVLCFTYGIMYGLGASLAYTPSLAILGHYFKRYLGVVNGLVTIGSSVFTAFIPSLMDYIIKQHGLGWNFLVLAIITFGIALCGLLFKPTPLMVINKSIEAEGPCGNLLQKIFNFEIWRNKKYRLWALSMPVALFGYFVPYVHIRQFIKNNFEDLSDYQVNLPLQCIAIASGVGRLVFGFLADKPGIDRILLQQISFYVIGTLTIILPFVKSFNLLIAITLGMGLFDGAFIALIGPIAFELCGSSNAAQAIGCMLGLAAMPLSVGPPIAGFLYKYFQSSYTVAFVCAGISPLVGATTMFAIRLHRNNNSQKENRNGAVTANGKINA